MLDLPMCQTLKYGVMPSLLKPGDKIAIVSPASRIYPHLVDAAARVIESRGYVPVLATHCKDCVQGYAGTAHDRLADLHAAFADPSIKAILCSRGGYGVVHLLEHLRLDLIAHNPKWLIGFSDISALHAAMHRAGVVSVHASMAKHLAEKGMDHVAETLFCILEGSTMHYSVPAHPLNIEGSAEGLLVGGNMAVLCGLIGTPFDLLARGDILFIEDIGEPIYKIERMLYNLRLNGTLSRIKGLVVGRFTECQSPDGTGETMEQMIRRMVEPLGIPVTFDFPCGHIHTNMPLLQSIKAHLEITPSATTLSQIIE